MSVKRVLDVDNVETTVVSLTLGDHTNTTHVASTSDVAQVSSVELDKVRNLVGFNVDFDGVVDLDKGVGVAEGTTIVGNGIRNTLGSELDGLDLAKFVFGLFIGDTVNGETSLGVVDETEVFTSLFDGDDV